MAKNMFLYWGSGSIPCWKPMIVLEEKGLSGYPNKKISFSEKEHKKEDVMALNPRGQVPTFKDGDFVVNESGAISFYLEKKYAASGNKLLPDDATEYGKVVQKVFETGNLDSNIVANIVRYRFTTPKDKLDQELLASRYESARTELQRWDKHLQQSAGFLVGSSFSMADVFFFPYVAFGVRLGLDVNKFPAIKAYYEKLKDRPSIKATWPPHWSEGDGDSSILGSV